ncbi:MAG: hypothetical protein AAB511_02845, partial [Patescibacteria group bacterium]
MSPASAQAAVFKGDAFVRFTGTGGATVDFALRTENVDGTGANRTTWELDAGSSVTLYFQTADSNGAILVPNIPDGDGTDSCALRVYYETGATNLVRTLYSGPTCPTDGQSYTFYGTSDGTSGGSPRAGTLRLYVDVVETNELTDNYDIDSDTNGDQGAIRSNVVVSDFTKNVYPAGSKYAYGTASNETMTFTASATDRYADRNIETFQINTRRNSNDALIENGGSQEWGTEGATADSFVADNTYDSSETTYDAEFEVLGSSGLLASEKWTAVSASSAIYKSATTAEKSALFVVDPRIYFSTDGTTASDNAISTYSVYNRGEVATSTFYLLNSQTEKLSRSMNLSVMNSGNTVESGPTSVTPSSTLYTFAYTIGSSDTAAADTTGSLKKLRASNTDQTKDSNNVFGVSSLYYIDAHPELDSTLNADDWPTEDANETTAGVIAADVFSFFAHVKNVRKDTNIDTSGSAITFTIKKPDASTRATQTSDTGTNGWTSNYDFPLESPAGSWSITSAVAFNGNSGTDSETLTFISPYTGNYAIGAVGWNQTYDINSTARFTIQTLKRDSDGIFQPTAADTAPTYRIRYWDGSAWQELVATTAMTVLGATATYEATYVIPNDSTWYGRKISVIFSATMSGTKISSSQEVKIVQPAVNWRGAWSSLTNYAAYDAVSYGGSSWRALVTNTNVTPTEGATWTILAQKGDTGATGAIGAAGATGTTGNN